MGGKRGSQILSGARPALATLALLLTATRCLAVCNFTTNKVQFLNGATLTYRLTITNNSGSGCRGIYVVDTVSPVLINQTSEAPPEFGTATIYATASGTLYTWAYDLGGSGPSILGNGETFTFTISGDLPNACALFGISNVALFQIAGSGCAGAAANPFNTVGTSSNLRVENIQTPPAPAAGSPIGYTIVITNTGTTTLTTLTVNDTVPTAIAGITTDMPPGFTAAGPTATGGGNWYGWYDTGSLSFAPGDALTFTITGTVAGTCVSSAVSNTAYAYGLTTGCGSSATFMTSNVTDFSINTYPTAITATLFQTGGGAGGDPVGYLLVVTNTGASTILDLTVVDTVPGVVTGQTTDQPAVMGAPVVSQVASGTRYVWSATGLTLSPTGSFSFTITGTTGVVCLPTAISNTAFAVASAFCGQQAVLSNPVGSDIQPPPAAGLVASEIQIGGGGTGSPLRYLLIVTNTGSITVTDLTVTDTVSAVLVSQTTDQPAAMGAPATGGVPSGTRYVWSATAMPVGLRPGASFTFTVSGQIGVVCAPTLISNTAYLEARGGCSATALFTEGVETSATPPVAALSIVKTLSPAAPGSGGPVTYRIVVTNFGSATLTNLMVTDTVEAAITAAAADQPPGWAAAALTPVAPSGSLFVWSNNALTFGPNAALTFTVTGVVGSCVPGIIANTAYVSGGNACSFAELNSNVTDFRIGAALAARASSQAVASVNQGFWVVLTVTNTGDDAADNILPDLAVGPGLALTASITGPVPAGPLSLPPGGSQSFTWTFSAVGAGVVTFTATAEGTACGGAAVLGVGRVSTTLQSPPALAAAIALLPSPRDTGQTFLVTVTITNTGGATATGVDLTPFLAGGTGAATQTAGPNPALPATIPGGGRMIFTWTFTGTAPGTVQVTTTVSGTDLNTGAPIPPAVVVSTAELIQIPAAFDASALMVPNQVSTGQLFTLFLTVTNIGQAAAAFTVPAFVNGSGPLATLVSGPIPAGPVTVAGGAIQVFRWTVSPAGAGPLLFSLSVTGTDVNNAAVVFAGRTVTGLSQIRAALTAGLALSSTSVGPGGTFTVRLTVTNTGQASATGLRPPVLALSGFGSATVAGGGWPPAGPVTLAGGGVLTWDYTFTAGLAGQIAINAAVTGADGNAGWPVSVTAPGVTLTVGSPSIGILSLTAGPASLGLDRIVTLVMTVSNTGRFVLNGLSPGAVALAGDGRMELVTGPQPISSSGVNPGDTVTFAWTFRSLRGGTVTFTAGVSATGAPAVPPATSNPVTIVEAGVSLKDAVVYPTPFDPESALGGLLKFRKLPPFSTVSIYTNAGELVRSLTADLNGTAAWDGRNDAGSRVFPGVYFYLLKSPAGERKRGKFEVAN